MGLGDTCPPGAVGLGPGGDTAEPCRGGPAGRRDHCYVAAPCPQGAPTVGCSGSGLRGWDCSFLYWGLISRSCSWKAGWLWGALPPGWAGSPSPGPLGRPRGLVLTVPERPWDPPSSQPGLCRMGCGRCSSSGNRGLAGQRGPHREGGAGPVLRVVDRSLGILWWTAETAEVWPGAPSGSAKYGHCVSCCCKEGEARGWARGLRQGYLARWSLLPALAPLAVAPACERRPSDFCGPVPALCSLHSRGQTPRAAVPSSLAGLSLGGPPSKRHPPSGAVKFLFSVR